MKDSPILQYPVSRTIPHIIDTVLLLSGATLVILVYGNLFLQPWLLVKLAALLVYIVLGGIALRYGHTRAIRIASLCGAWLVFFYIIAIAISKSPLPIPGIIS